MTSPSLLDDKLSALTKLKQGWKSRWFKSVADEIIDEYPAATGPSSVSTVESKDKKFVVELYANDSLLERARKMATISLKMVMANNVDEAMIDRAAFGIAQALDIYARSDNEQKRKQQNNR